MIYSFARTNLDKLIEVRTILVQREDRKKNRKDSPLFYLDLLGKNALVEALNNREFTSFNLMLEMMTKY